MDGSETSGLSVNFQLLKVQLIKHIGKKVCWLGKILPSSLGKPSFARQNWFLSSIKPVQLKLQPVISFARKQKISYKPSFSKYMTPVLSTAFNRSISFSMIDAGF